MPSLQLGSQRRSLLNEAIVTLCWMKQLKIQMPVISWELELEWSVRTVAVSHLKKCVFHEFLKIQSPLSAWTRSFAVGFFLAKGEPFSCFCFPLSFCREKYASIQTAMWDSHYWDAKIKRPRQLNGRWRNGALSCEEFWKFWRYLFSLFNNHFESHGSRIKK